jgi:hypothetical protein
MVSLRTQVSRVLLSAAVAWLGIAALPSSAFEEPADPEPIPKKQCCQQHTPKEPATGCPAPPCSLTPNCPAGLQPGSYNEGKCVDGTAVCTGPSPAQLATPLFECRPTKVCTIAGGGGPGKTCQFDFMNQYVQPFIGTKVCSDTCGP